MNTQFFTVKNIIFGSLLLVFFSIYSIPADASTVVRSGNTVSIAEEQVIEGDFYTAAGKINVSGSIQEDMVAVGGQVAINGEVGEDVFLIGGQTDIHGTIGDDLRIISGETTIAESVAGDVLVVGGSLNVLSTASISGDLILLVSEATIEGSVGGDILGTAGVLKVDAQVAGDIDVVVEQLTLGDRANIEGSVRYVSNLVAVKALSTSVSGDIVRNDPVLLGGSPNAYAAFVPVLVLLFSVLVWYFLSRKSLTLVAGRALAKSPRPFVIGVAVLIFAPLAGVLLLLSVVGTLVGLALLTGYTLLVVLSIIGSATVLGKLLMVAFNQSTNRVSLLSLLVGVVGSALLMLLPVIGFVIFVLLMILTLGAMVDLLVRPVQE